MKSGNVSEPQAVGFPPPHGGRLTPSEDAGPRPRSQTPAQGEQGRAGRCGLAASRLWREEHYSPYIWKSVGVFICWEVWVPSPGGARSQSGQRTNRRRAGVGRQGGAEARAGHEGAVEGEQPDWVGQTRPGCGSAWAKPSTCWVDVDGRPLSQLGFYI